MIYGNGWDVTFIVKLTLIYEYLVIAFVILELICITFKHIRVLDIKVLTKSTKTYQ